MLARQRQGYILDRVREDGGVRVADLVRELGVSDMTIRRDLELLHDRGLIEKVHGGATALDGSALFEPGFAAKSALQQSEKDAIADARRDSGRAGHRDRDLGRDDHLQDRPSTGRRRVADRRDQFAPGRRRPPRSGRSDQTIILTGGVRTPSDALVGPFAVAALRNVHLDLVLLGVHGMDEQSGFTSPNLNEAETDRALIDSGRRLIVVADHSKWGIVGLSSIGGLDRADVLITDDGIDPAAREILAGHVRRLVVATPDRNLITEPNPSSKPVSSFSPPDVSDPTVASGLHG